MLRWRLRRSRCSILGDDHLSLLRRGLRSITPRGGHRLRGRGRQFRIPYGLLSGLIKRALRGVAARKTPIKNTGSALFSSFFLLAGGCGALARTGTTRIGEEEVSSSMMWRTRKDGSLGV